MYRIVLSIISLLLCACGPGVADFTENIGKTGYYFSRTSSAGMAIYPEHNITCTGGCGHIESKVLSYQHNKNVIVAMRQVRNDYLCDEGHMSMEILADVVFQYIEIESGKTSAKYTKDEFLEILKDDLFLGIEMDYLLKNSVGLSRLHTLSGCTNPRLTSALSSRTAQSAAA